jgi:steroid delta-isomerase-like uncharacterized protein
MISEQTRQTEQSRQVMSEYLDVLLARGDYARFFSDDVAFRVMGTDQEAHGREGVEQFIRYLHEIAFDSDPQVVNVIVSDDQAALEAIFVGKHIAEFAGVPASGKQARLPYSVCYTIRDGLIAELRAYVAMSELVRQIS